ncbi:MAG: hypothetical protein IKV15_02565 [Bacteroidaceae bacterium]|nr:hypothetical protein [Bacteroidaceae bacterium]
MKVNYLIIAIAAFILSFIIWTIFDIKYSRMNKDKKLSSVDFKDVFVCSISGPVIACLFFLIFSSKIYIIKPYKEHSEEHYVLFYKDYKGRSHIVVPFTNYISNESNRNIKIYSVGYGTDKYKKYPTYHYKRNEFTRIEEEPYYFFEEAPHKIRSQSDGGRRNVLDYDI